MAVFFLARKKTRSFVACIHMEITFMWKSVAKPKVGTFQKPVENPLETSNFEIPRTVSVAGFAALLNSMFHYPSSTPLPTISSEKPRI